jgi:chorismate mutase/prephenate dehydratase
LSIERTNGKDAVVTAALARGCRLLGKPRARCTWRPHEKRPQIPLIGAGAVGGIGAIERQAVASNGEAARMASEDTAVAAIAGERAAQRFGLHAVAAHIQDDPNNRTRFVVLGAQTTQPSAPPARDKTSLILSVPNRAGAVFHMLKPLAAHHVSMTRLESRPARVGTWEYYFYVDIEGHEQEPKVAVALEQLRSECAFYKSLGSYPVAS